MQSWTGFLELNGDRGLVRCDFIPDGGVMVVYIEDERVHVEDRDWFGQNYGDRFFGSQTDFDEDKPALTLDQVWPAE